jgi:hypothetical protein
MTNDTDNRLVALPGTLAGAQRFLHLVTKRFPPIARHAHSFTLYQGKLQLNLVSVAPCWKFTFDAEDLAKSPEHLVQEIAMLMPPKDAA